ncbi:MAG: TonB-dependent receptor [Terriglobales bacterium]
MRVLIERVLIAAVLTTVLAAQAAGLRGVVVAGNGLPIAGAHVTAGARSAVTAGDGSFSLPATTGRLRVSAPGYLEADVTPGTAPLRVVLRPQPLTESVTVTASARNQTAASATLATAVMGRTRLRSAAPPNFDSILREFSDLGTFRANSSQTANPTTQGVALLGTGSSGASRALVLLDGLPLNDMYGGWVDWLRVPDEAVESVSVVSGGASPLYGNDALAGVIGIETAAPLTTHLDLRTGGGGLGTALADTSGVVAGKALSLAVRGRGLRVGGYVPAANPGAVDRNAGVVAQDWQPQLRWLASPRAMFALSSEYFGENRQNGTFLQTNGTRLRQLALRGVVEAAGGVWSGSLFNQSEDFDASFSAVATDRNSERLTLLQAVPSRAQGAALDWSSARAGWELTLGGSYLHIAAVDQEATPPNFSALARSENGRQRLGGGFAELSWHARAHWAFTGTLRRDGWGNYDAFQATPGAITPYPSRGATAWSPALGAVWQLQPWLTLHASGYESFRAPTLNELYRPFRAGNVLTEANPLLAAERYRGAQVGGDVALGAATHVRASYFDGTIVNLVTSVTLAVTPGLITRQRQNLGRARSRGLTLADEWQARRWLAFWASYTHLRSAVLQAPAVALIGNQVAHVPANNASFRALMRSGPWLLSAVERFGGANFDDDQNHLPLPAFWTADLYASRSFGRWSPYLGVENLFNRRYTVELTPEADLNAPRAITAGVRVQLGSRR